MAKTDKKFDGGNFDSIPSDEKNRILGAVKSGNLNDALSAMRPEDAKKARELINDRAALEKLLKSPEAQRIIKMFSGKKGDFNEQRG